MRPLLPTLLTVTLFTAPALAQSITPAADGTGTLVMPDGSTYQITGGTRSGDGANLFHSFEQFGLTAAEVANFLADPAVQNILGRITGGNASVINGLLQVSGSSANLYLLNPAGILFGPNSALNLEGSFTATTASGLGFGENWLQALGEVDYTALGGNPTGLTFGSEPGALINLGNLAVNSGEAITLASGAVINLGTLNAPGGQIVVLAVPGENRVSIRPEGAILSLELATLPEGELSTAPPPFSPLDIPALLRAGEPEVATGIAINPDGTVSLAGSSAALPTTPGTALVSGTVDVRGETGGVVQVLGDRIAVTAATIDSSGIQGGGQILIGGQYQGRGTTPTASRTYVDARSTLRADAGERGDGGEVILWANEGTRFDGTITARGGAMAGDGGFVEVSGHNTLAFNGRVDVSAAQGKFGTLLLDPTNITIESVPPSSPGVDASLPDILAAELPGNIVINSTVLESQVGNVVLQATNDITIAPGVSLNFVPGGSIAFTADADGDLAGAFTMDTTQSINALGTDIINGRDVTISGATVTVGNINTGLDAIGSTTNGGNIQITSTAGGITTGTINTRIRNGIGNSGGVTLTASGGGITTAGISSFAANGSSGNLSLTTNAGNITTGNLTTLTNTTVAGSQAGSITLSTPNGAIVAGNIDSRASNFGPGGAVTVTSNFGSVTLGSVDSTSGFGTSGNVNLRSNGSDLTISGLINAGTTGSVTLNNDSGGMTTANIVAGSVSANSFSAQPFSFGNITAAGSIFLANRGSTLTTGNLSATTDGISVASGFGGVLTLGTANAGTSINLSSGNTGTITVGNLTAGTQVNVTTGTGGSLTTGGIASGPGVFGLSIVLQADEMDFLGGAGSVQAPGRLLVQTAAAGQPIVLGGADDSGPGTLDLTATDLAALANGFSDIVVGGIFSGIGTGPITLSGDVAFSDPLILRTNGIVNTTGSTLSGIGNASLTLEAGAGVTTGAISTQGQPVVIEGDRDGNGDGSVTVAQPITTGGGNIILTGASTTDRAIFIASPGTINSQGGDIVFTGTSTGLNEGIITFAPITSGGGDIVFVGSSTGGDGITLSFLTGSVDSGGGDITMTGTGNTGITILSGVTVAAGTGNIALNTDNPRLQGPIIGSGNLQIQPLTPSLPITLGGTGDAAVTFLNQNEINQLGNGFSSRTVGQVGNTGPIALEPFTLASPLTLAGGVLTGPSRDTTFALAPDGSLEIGGFGAPLRLLNPTEIIGGSDATNTVLGSAGDDTFTIVGDGTGLLGAVRFSGISAFDGGAGFDTVAGTGANNVFVVTSNSGGYNLSSAFLPDISFTNVERLATGTGSDTVEIQGVPLDLEVVGGDRLTLLGGPDVILNANVSTPGDLTISAGAIAQTGGQVTVGGNTSLFASGNIGLGGNNDFTTVTVSSGQNVILRDRNNLQLNDLAFSGGLQVTAAGDLTATTNILPGSGMAPMILAAGSPGDVSLTSGGNLTTADITAPGSPIVLDAGGAIATGNLNSSGSNGGPVSLQGSRIQVNSINTQGTLNGGAITALTPGTFQALGSFIDQTGIAASLSTVGGSRGGAVTLGYGSSTFTLGDPSVNGTREAITTGDVTLLPDGANPILGSRIFGRGLPGQVQFISFGDIPIEVEPPPDDIDPVPDPQQPLELLDDDSPVFLTSAGESVGQEQFSEAEDAANSDFADYFGDLIKSPRSLNLAQAQATLRDIADQTGEVPALMYMRLNRSEKPGEGGVELLLITAEGDPTRVRVLNTTAEEVLKTQEQLRRQITNPSLTHNTAYLTAAQQLYGWLIAPIAAELQAAGVTNIGFVMDAGLRTLPLAALHNGERFLIEDYSVGLIPSLGLIDPTYVPLNRQNSTLLVSGASQFVNQPPLLAAGVEMSTLQTLWPSTKLAETNFTVSNLQRDRRQAQIIHMATHAQFLRGAPHNSYLQFFDGRLRLNQVPELGWFAPQVELVTLSACQTAMGNTDAELGFAGFALVAGAKSALASLWKISDEATAGLMTTFYQTLDQAAIKADALRSAQLAMIRGEVYTESGQLIWPRGALTLPPDLVVDGRQDLSHPFYWAAFTMVGSPW